MQPEGRIDGVLASARFPVRRIVRKKQHKPRRMGRRGHYLLNTVDVLHGVVAAKVLRALVQQMECFTVHLHT